MAKNSIYVPRVINIEPEDWEKMGVIAGLQKKHRQETVRRAIKYYIGIAMPPKVEIMYSQLQKEVNQ